jgi:cytochrome c-type biogenesis protein CcmF
MDIKFAGEHLYPGILGQFFVVLSFGTALLAAISYYFATVNETPENSWKRIARIAFQLNTAAVVGIGASLFYIIYNHFFEYHYAWAHSSKALPVHFIISCFWEGQEGSFWLWTFWQAVLGNILLWRAKSWETSVMTIVCVSQAFLASMLLGVEIFGQRVGSSPFILLRDAVDLKAMAPVVFADAANYATYLNFIKDGNGLNPLLQNYWMVIHPPTLFLGFASMVVPFSYAIAGLWTRRYADWMKPGLPWALFACMILGTGIIMGAFWAYEALNFGGFWAWDPVENASIIPWITLIAAVHVMLSYKHTGHSYFTSAFLVLISFVLVLYASFLTRSGILGETSVHAFTDLGMYWHLILYFAVFVVISTWFLVSRWKELPITKKDEETYSREFWLFIGALVLTVACIQIIATTSIPVFNAVFGTKVAPPTNIIQHYNKWQLPFAVVIALISGFTQFLKYKNTDPRKFFISISVSVIAAALIAGVASYITNVYTNYMFILLLFAATFSIIANAKILGEAFKGKWKLAGSAVAHIGFAFILAGGMVAAATNRVVSVNNSGTIPIEGFDKVDKSSENILLNQNEPQKMDEYTVTYIGDSTVGPNTFYQVNYKVIDEKTGKINQEFNLYPNAQQNAKMGAIIASPDTKHYLFHDIYTHVNGVPLKAETHDDHEGHSDEENYMAPEIHEVAVGDTVIFNDGFIVVKAVNSNATIQDITLSKNDVAVGMQVDVVTANKTYPAEPIFLLKDGNKFDFGKTIEPIGLKLRFTNVYPKKGKLELTVLQKKPGEKKWIVMKAVVFPYINLLWGGTIIMVIGFLLSIFRRNKELAPKS